MSDEPAYDETIRMQRSTGIALAVVFALSFAPLAMYVGWSGGLRAAGLTAVGYVVVLGVFLTARWQFQVTEEGLRYRVLPFFPVWRTLAAPETVRRAAPTDRNVGDLVGRSGLFRGPDGERVVGADFEGGVRVRRREDPDVVVSSRRPERLAEAIETTVKAEPAN